MSETKIPLFRRFVIQNFPFIEKDFDALTDYQLISKVVEYLNKVIESQNGVVTQMNELIYFVEHYFDNLDVQEMINNKLDAMVADGTMAEIINQEIFTDLNNSRTHWKNVVSLGMHNDGTTANDSALATILATAEDGDVFYFPKGTYLFNSRVSFDNLSNITLRFEGEIKSENGVIFDTLTRCKIDGIRIIRDYTRYDYTSLLNTGLEIKNSKYLAIYNPYIAGFNKGIFWHSDGQSNSYNDLYNVHIFDCLHSWSTINENGGFTNEINTFGGRFSLNTGETDVSGIADHVVIPDNTNMQNFYGVCMEDKFTKVNIAGDYCSLIGCRFEGQDSGLQDIVISGNANTIKGCFWSEQVGSNKIIDTGDYNVISAPRQEIIHKNTPKNPITITSDYTLNKTYNFIKCDCTNNDIKVTLANNFTNAIDCIVRIQKVDYSNHGVKLSTTGQNYYQFIGRGLILKKIGDYVDMYFDGTTWVVSGISNLYETSLPTTNENNVVEGLIYQDGINQKIVAEGGTYAGSQITNTYCSTTANSADIGLIIGSSNRTLQVGNYIEIAGETGYFKIVKLDLTELTATLDRACTNTNANTRITYHYAVKKYLGLIYDKVDSTPATGKVGDIVFFNTPTAGGYIGAVYTSTGWKNFGAIEA